MMLVKEHLQDYANLKTHNYNTRFKHDYDIQNHNLEHFKQKTVYAGNNYPKYIRQIIE